MKFLSGYKITFLFLLLTSFAFGQATITIEVQWPSWSSENRVTFRDPSNIQIGSSICNPTTCYVGGTNNSYNNIGNRATYTGVPYGTGYNILLEDMYGDGWNGASSYVRVYQDGVLIVDTDLLDPFSQTVTFDILDTDKDGVPDQNDLDNDNDGILDSVECSAPVTGVQTGTNIRYFNNAANAQGPPGTSYAWNPLSYPGESSILLLKFPAPVPVGTEVSVFLAADSSVATSDIQLQRSTSAGGFNGFIMDASISSAAGIVEYKFTVTGSALEYFRVEAYQTGARVHGARYGGCEDTDADGIADYLDFDSDADGCNDADEAYNDPNADTDDNGRYGSGTPTVDGDGKVIGAPYTVPVDSDSNGSPDFLVAGSTITITAQPQNQNVILGGTASFSVSVTGMNLGYQWYVSTDGGNNYTAITGETTGSLMVNAVSAAEDGNLYRVEVRDVKNLCSSRTSSSAILTTDTDSDGDGVLDRADLDDDNDGILDTVECSLSVLWVTLGTPEPEEQNTINKLEALGYTVTVVDHNVGGNADNFSVTFIYEDVTSGTAAANVANLATTTKGIITSESLLHDDILGGVPGSAAAATFITITNNTHPITTGLPLGNLNIGQGAHHAGNLNSGTVLADHANGNIGIAVWETGQPMETGTAPGRRTIVPFSNGNAPFNAAAEDLLVNAIVWTAGNASSCDTDSDGIPNVEDPDSDNDGCSDADEAYNDLNADTDNNGRYGSGTPTADGDGKVVGAPYTQPVDSDNNGSYNFLEVGTTITITTQPQDQNVPHNGTATFSVSATGSNLNYQWFVSTNGGTSFTAITGETAATLNIDPAIDTDDGNLYRAEIDDANAICDPTVSDAAVLNVSPNQPPVFTATGNQNYCPGFSVPIAESIGITDPDDTGTSAVYIQISSGYIDGEDLLTLTGTHPTITATWNPSEGELSLTGPATYSEFEAAILAVAYASSAAAPTGSRQFSITVGEANYLPSTGHYYMFIDALGITWTDANTAANGMTYFGLQGYLATLTSQKEADFSGSQAAGTGWIGGSDAATEGVWRWVTGPEAGLNFWNGTEGGSSPNFAFWNTDEPNQQGEEDYAHITHPNINPNGSWNDLTNTGATSGDYQPQGYVVEYGGMPGDPALSISDVTSITMVEAITTQPVDQTVGAGDDAIFSVTASGTSITYQWQKSTDSGSTFADIPSATSSSYSFSTSLGDNGNQYRVVVSDAGNVCNPVISSVATLTVKVNTVITNRRITQRVNKN